MAESDKQSRTEKPTGQRINKAKEKGNLPRSKELASTATLLAAIVTLYTTGDFIMATLKSSSRELLAGMGSFDGTQTAAYSLMLKVFMVLAIVLGPYLAIVLASGLVINVAQEPLSFSAQRLCIDLTRLN